MKCMHQWAIKTISSTNKTAIAVALGGFLFATQGAFQPIEASEKQPLPEHIQAVADARFENGYPTKAAARSLEDEIFFQRAVQVYLWALPAINMYGMKEGTAKNFGEGYNVLSIYKNRLNAKTLITTPNSDVIYGIGFLDLAKDGPMVLDVPPNLQALIDDMWHRAIEGPMVDGKQYLADIGLPGPTRARAANI